MAAQAQRPTFLKLGGSLITEKGTLQTPRLELLRDLVRTIAEVWHDQPELRLVLGHGSGSFGHIPAKRYGTRRGVSTPDQWRGYGEVWYQASALNRLVIEACWQADLPVISFPPSASVVANNGEVDSWDLRPLESALKSGLVPVVFGDVVPDLQIGGTILSTEDLFAHLAAHLRPSRILLAGQEPGVWTNFPDKTELIPIITTADRGRYTADLQGARGTDVTGGMESKVNQMLDLLERIPDLCVQIFSGTHPLHIRQALLGAAPGTTLRAAVRDR